MADRGRIGNKAPVALMNGPGPRVSHSGSCLRIVDAELLGFDHFEFGRQLDWKVGGLLPLRIRPRMNAAGRSINVEPTKILFSGGGPPLSPPLCLLAQVSHS